VSRLFFGRFCHSGERSDSRISYCQGVRILDPTSLSQATTGLAQARMTVKDLLQFWRGCDFDFFLAAGKVGAGHFLFSLRLNFFDN